MSNDLGLSSHVHSSSACRELRAAENVLFVGGMRRGVRGMCPSRLACVRRAHAEFDMCRWAGCAFGAVRTAGSFNMRSSGQFWQWSCGHTHDLHATASSSLRLSLLLAVARQVAILMVISRTRCSMVSRSELTSRWSVQTFSSSSRS